MDMPPVCEVGSMSAHVAPIRAAAMQAAYPHTVDPCTPIVAVTNDREVCVGLLLVERAPPASVGVAREVSGVVSMSATATTTIPACKVKRAPLFTHMLANVVRGPLHGPQALFRGALARRLQRASTGASCSLAINIR